MQLPVALQVLPHGEGLPLPAYATAGSAGCDLRAAVRSELRVEPGHRTLVPTGFAIALPEGWEAQVRPRSGLAIQHGLTVLNAPGTIDADYRGEIKVALVNLGDAAVVVARGDRIAQLVFAPVVKARWQVVDSLDETNRGAGGFGSSGRR
jgi:dUTP pyrophosphatase